MPFNHKEDIVLGRTKNNTLTLKIDATGLDYESVLPSHRSDVYELVEGGYVYESSFAFTTMKSTWGRSRPILACRTPVRSRPRPTVIRRKSNRSETRKGRELFDLSPVTYAQYEGTTTDTRIAKRSLKPKSEQNPKRPHTRRNP